jgi:hypothetical protein
MIEVEMQIPAFVKPNNVISQVEKICSENDLTLTLKGTLAKYSGCVHWHFKKHKQAGTLESTWWERNTACGSKWHTIGGEPGSRKIFQL